MGYSKDDPALEDKIKSIQTKLKNLCNTVERMRKEEKRDPNKSYREHFLASVKLD